MIRRYAGLIAIGIALGAGTASAQQNVDAAIAARAGDKALKDCLDRSAYVRSYRTDTAWAAGAARDPNAPAKFNCSGIGGNWQEVAPKACCAAYERDKGKKASAWQELQTCGWRDWLPKSRAIYEDAARRCLAQTAAKPATPPQQAQKPQTPAPKPTAPQQQAQRPQPTPPSHAPQETHRPPAWPAPSWPTPAPAYPPYGGPAQQGQVPLTPPPPPIPPAGPTQQAQVPLVPPPPPIPPGGPVQQTQVPTGGDFSTEAPKQLIESVAGNPACAQALNPKSRRGALVLDDAGGFRLRRGGNDEAVKPAGRRPGRALPLLNFPGLLDAGLRSFNLASSEHGSIRGTINGGGDFVNVENDPAYRNNRCIVAGNRQSNEIVERFEFNTAGITAVLTSAAGGDAQKMSSEHSSIRGTINGGGDFIYYVEEGGPKETPETSAPKAKTGARESLLDPPREGIEKSQRPEGVELQFPNVEVTPRGTTLMVDVGRNGVIGVGVLDGSVRVRDKLTGTTRESGPNTVVIAIPGRGVSMPVVLPDALAVESRKYLAAAKPQIAQAPPGPRLSEATPARGVKDGRPVDPGAVFTPEINPIYVWFRLDGVAAATKLRQVWHYLGAGADRTIGEGEFTARAGAKWADVKYALAEGKRWPLGEYRVEIFAGDRRLASVPFRVAEAGALPRIVQTQPARGVKDGKPVDPRDAFAPDAKTIHVWFRIAGVNAPTKLRGVWNYLRPGGDEFIAESVATVQPGHDWGGFQIEGPPDRPWPTGNYRLDILLGDTKAASVPFRVVGAAQPAIVATRAALGVRGGEPVNPTELFRPDAGTIYVWFRMAGHNAPTVLRGVWHYLGGGKDQVIISSEMVIQPNQDWGDFQLELPPGKPWPMGEYRTDILIDGKLAASVPFRVQAPAAKPVAEAAPKIVEAKAARGVTEGGMPVGASEVFAPDAGRLFVWFRIAGHDRPVKLLSEWHYLGAGKDELLADIEMTGQPGKDGGHFALDLLPGRLWPLGAYRVDILIDGKAAASVSFRVQAPAAKPVAEAAPKIVEAKAARGVTEGGMPVDPTEVFARDAGPIYVWFRYAGIAATTKFRAIWRFVEPGSEQTIAEDEAGAKSGNAGYFKIELPPGNPWPAGAYRLDIMIGDQVAASVPFRVAEVPAKPIAAPRVTVSEVRVARGVKDGKPVDPGAVFPPDVSPLYVWFRVAGNTEPVKLRGEWRYLGGGQDRIVSKAEGELKAGSTSANFRRTLAEGKSWEVGNYRFDIFAGGALAASVPFRIEAATAKPAAAPAPAAAGITLAGVEALLRELGADPQRQTRADGVPFFEFTIDGRKTALALYGCAPGPCAQALLYTGFRTDKKVTPQTINDWNREQRLVRAYLDRNGDPVVESDLVVAGAQTATMREWIATWRQRVPQFMAHLTK